MVTQRRGKTTRRKPMSLINIMKISVVVWTASLLTAYYAKLLPQIDATFIAGLLTSTLGSMGVDIMRKQDDEPSAPSAKPSIPPKP